MGGSTDETTNENTNGTRSELSHGVHAKTAVLGSPVRRAPTNQRGLTASHLAKVGPMYVFLLVLPIWAPFLPLLVLPTWAQGLLVRLGRYLVWRPRPHRVAGGRARPRRPGFL